MTGEKAIASIGRWSLLYCIFQYHSTQYGGGHHVCNTIAHCTVHLVSLDITGDGSSTHVPRQAVQSGRVQLEQLGRPQNST